MASIASAEFKRMFGLKRGHEGHLTCGKRNNVFSAIFGMRCIHGIRCIHGGYDQKLGLKLTDQKMTKYLHLCLVLIFCCRTFVRILQRYCFVSVYCQLTFSWVNLVPIGWVQIVTL